MPSRRRTIAATLLFAAFALACGGGAGEEPAEEEPKETKADKKARRAAQSVEEYWENDLGTQIRGMVWAPSGDVLAAGHGKLRAHARESGEVVKEYDTCTLVRDKKLEPNIKGDPDVFAEGTPMRMKWAN